MLLLKLSKIPVLLFLRGIGGVSGFLGPVAHVRLGLGPLGHGTHEVFGVEPLLLQLHALCGLNKNKGGHKRRRCFVGGDSIEGCV